MVEGGEAVLELLADSGSGGRDVGRRVRAVRAPRLDLYYIRKISDMSQTNNKYEVYKNLPFPVTGEAAFRLHLSSTGL